MWKRIRKNYRRWIASLLTMAMVVTNAGGNLGTIFAAGETENALFLVEGEDLRQAIREAEKQGEVFDFSSLQLAAKRKSIKNRYEKLLGKKEGAVYALDLEIDDSYAPEGTELQVFYNAETEDVIFLFLNGSDMVVDYRVNIDGYETEPVRVNPNTVNVEMDGEEAPAYAENYEAADMIDDEVKKLGAEVIGSQETSAAEKDTDSDESQEEIGDAVTDPEEDEVQTETEESSAADEVEETTAAEGNEDTVSDVADDKTESGEEDSEAETEAEVTEETEAEEEPETEAELEEVEAEEEDSEEGELLSISRHEAAVVTVSLDELEDEEDAEVEIAEEETEEETEAEIEEETEAETESEKETEAETESEGKTEETETEADSENKVEETEDGTEEESKPEESEAEEEEGKTEESGAETGADITIEETEGEKGEEISDEGDSSVDVDFGSDSSAKNDGIDMEGQLLEDDDVEILGELKGKEYDTVTVLDHVNARAWKIAWEDIEAIISESDGAMEYVVDYQVNIPEAAEVKGVDSVAEGEDLYFAVESEEGYEIAGVYANGMELEAVEDASDLASASNWKGYSYVYVVEGVEEDVWVEVEMAELEPIIVAKTYTKETGDAVFTVNVPEDAFEEEVELQVTKIVNKAELEELSKQANAALKSNKAVADLMAYDVTFVSAESGAEVEPSKAVEVSIRLKKAVVSEKTDQADVTGISVVHLPEDDKAEVVAAAKNPEEKEFEFQTDGFSIYVIAAEKAASVELDGVSYETITQAIDAVTNGENATIVLLEDISENVVSANKDYILDLNGKVLSSKTIGQNVYTINGGSVTIKNGTIRDGDCNNKTNLDGKGIKAVDANVTVENCLIKQNKGYSKGGGIYAEKGTFSLINSDVVENTATYGGGIYAIDCKVKIEGSCKISGNKGSNSAGSIYVKNGSLTIIGGDSEDDARRTVEISDNTGTATNAPSSGMYLYDCSVVIKNAKISHNGYHGVEIKNTNADIETSFVNVEFSNHDKMNALYVDSQGTFTAENCDFINNNLTYDRDYTVTPVYLKEGGKKTFTGCTFSGNSATSTMGTTATSIKKRDTCGALYIGGKGDVLIDNCKFTNNKGKYGALITKVAATTITGGSVFSGNIGTPIYTGATAVGAIWVSSGTVTISGAVIKNNSVTSTLKTASGGINVAGGTFNMNTNMGDVAVYGNLYNGEVRDLYLNTGFSSIEILPAQEMRDPADSKLKWGAWNDGNQDVTEKLVSRTSSKTGVWKSVEKTVSEVAQIGDKKYETLALAVEEAKEGDTILLLEEAVPVFETLKISKNVKIDMNNCRIEPSGTMSSYDALISISGGGKLTLTGDGVLGNWVDIPVERTAGKTEGTLYLDGNIKVESLSSNDAPIESYGTVIINKDIDSLKINVYKGSVELNKGTNAGKLDILENVGFKKIYPKNVVINGSVENLILTQIRTQKTDTAEATINGKIGTLTLKHTGCKDGLPMTYAGENFSAEFIKFTPSVGYTNPKLEDLRDPKKADVKDILIIQGSDSHPISAEQIRKENVIWDRSGLSDSAILEFLVRPDFDEKGNLVLRKSISNGIYLDGVKGDDTNSGLSADSPVKTFEHAKELLIDAESLDTIYIVGTVTVTEPDAAWTFGDIEGNEGNNKQYKIQRYPKHYGALIHVAGKGKLTLEDIIVDGGGNINKENVFVSSPLVMNDGELTITAGTVLRDNHNAYEDVGYEGGAVRNAGTLIVNGGIIEQNSAVSGGGVFNRGTFTFSGGEIKNNAGKGKHKSKGTLDKNGNYKKEIYNAGGGVFIAGNGNMTMTGTAKISENTAKLGGGIALGNNHNVYVGGILTMTGGVIDSNESEMEGGGIFIQEDCKAKITQGEITNNKSHGGAFGGGGVYVNGGTGLGTKNGLLELENVKISNNEASGKGGGIAACPSSNVNIYLDDGGLIKYNSGKGTDFDIYGASEGQYGKYSSAKIYLSRYMMGGESYEWTNVPGQEGDGFSVYSASEKVSAKEEQLLVKITGNTADTNGGGIGTNGDVIIGKSNSDLIKVSVSKEWKYDKDGEVVSGIASLKPVNEAIGSVTFQLQERKVVEGQDSEAGWKNVTYGGKANSVPNGEKWSTIEFINLRRVDAEGNAVEYRVIELADDGFIVVDTTHKEEDSGNSSWVFTNMPVYSLRISKAVEDDYNKYSPEKKFAFDITLNNADDSPYEGIVSAVKGSITEENSENTDESVEVEFVGGKASVSLGKDEYIHLKDLTAGMKYSVMETEDDDYETRVNGEINNTFEGIIKIGANDVKYTNTVKEPHGKLRISKQVEDGNLARDWHFTIELQNADGNPLETVGKVYPFTYYDGDQIQSSSKQPILGGKAEVVLKHNESVEIDDLPAGTVCIVKEKEANTENYTTIVEEKAEADTGIGKIKEEETSEVKFTNKLNTGKLEVSKTVSAPDGNLANRNKEKEFTFIIELKDGENQPLKSVTPSTPLEFAYTGSTVEGVEGATAPEDGSLAFDGETAQAILKLKHGQKITLTGIPAGTKYTVTEQTADMDEYYLATVTGGEVVSENEAVTGSTGMIEKDNTASVDFVNVVKTGDLVISKIVSGNHLTDTDKTTSFTFKVELTDKDGRVLTGSYRYTGSREGTISSGDTVNLAHGEVIHILDIPEGTTYRVTETTDSGYTVSIKGGTVVTENGTVVGSTGNIEEETGAQVTFINTIDTGALSIQKAVTGNGGDKNQSFTFHVVLTGADGKALTGDYSYTGTVTEAGVEVPEAGTLTFNDKGEGTIALKHGQKITLSDLPAGSKYQVTEAEANQNGYTTTATADAGTIAKDATQEAVFVNDKPNTPNRPHNPGGGGSSNPPSGGGNTPGGPGTTTIDEPGVPLANFPPEPVNEIIEDSEVPLAALPRTGDSRHTKALLMMFSLAGLGMLLTAAGLKKRKDESDD